MKFPVNYGGALELPALEPFVDVMTVYGDGNILYGLYWVVGVIMHNAGVQTTSTLNLISL